MSLRPLRLARAHVLPVFAVLALSALSALALVPQPPPARFAKRLAADPSARAGVRAEAPEDLPDGATERRGWDAFRARWGGAWQVRVDRRSGVPLLVEGTGIEWFPAGTVTSLAALEERGRQFLGQHARLLRVAGEELVLDEAASGPLDADHALLVFGRRVHGIPVAGHRLLLHVTRGRLVAFGAERWSATPPAPGPLAEAATARTALLGHLDLAPAEPQELEAPRLEWIGVPPADEKGDGPYAGATGAGLALRPAWTFRFRVDAGQETWVARIDALDGSLLAFWDDTKYGAVKGGVFPLSDDGIAPDGIEQAGWPMPFADVTVGGSATTASTLGVFSGSGTARTALAGPYIKVQDVCGAIDQASGGSGDIDLGAGPGTDCAVPPGGSPGDTHAARSGFYHLNRAMEKGRAWLPDNAWLKTQVVDNVNIDATCNATWNGQANFYKSGGGCRNTGEIAAIFVHEWGHGLDQNDGGGYDNPSEVYADGVAMLQLHSSCIGRGFNIGSNCGGYGNACLDCTGVRDQDWDRRAQHQPSTPGGFLQNNCSWWFSSGPCGREVHCEAYLAGEVLWDLAARDLPASGMDAASAWQLLDRLFYLSRKGSGGNMYNCSLPNADGCGAGTLFTRLRTIDDDDGNLANGTPHAAAIYAAFARHGIACGAAGDASNASHGGCPALARPSLTVTAAGSENRLSWGAVPGAARYVVLRTEMGCDAGQTIVATVAAPATSWTDTGVPAGLKLYYRVQAEATTAACGGPVSNCATTSTQDGVGSIALDRAVYACSSTVAVTVHDPNAGAPSVTARLWSGTETAPETVVLQATAPGSADYAGSLPLGPAPAAPGDGRLAVAHGDTVTAEYIDANDGTGGSNVPRRATAAVDCAAPAISAVAARDVTDSMATIAWTTDTPSDSFVTWGPERPPTHESGQADAVTAHAVTLTGLAPCTAYWYRVASRDPAGNAAVDDAGGAYYRFETLGTYDGMPGACHAGRVALDRDAVACADTLSITLTDGDLDAAPDTIETAVVTVSSTTSPVPERLVVTETGPGTARFTGALPIAPGVAVDGDGILQVAGGDLVTAVYRDADDGSGSGAVAADSGRVDCAAAPARGVRVTGLTATEAVVEWATDEPTTTRLEWGPTDALGSVLADDTPRTAHAMTLQPLTACTAYSFRITSTDARGNVRVDDQGGAPYRFNAGNTGGTAWRETFESSAVLGWSLGGEWQIAAPQGRGTPKDPQAAFAGERVLGHDLSGLGTYKGNYEPSRIDTATSPKIDASAVSGGVLKFARWLNVSGRAVASVEVSSGGTWHEVWSSSRVTESGWSQQSIDVAAWADHNASFQVRFRQTGNGDPDTKSGWNVDEIELVSAGGSNGGACGGCGGAPSFGGVVSAVDVDPCGGGGIRLAWDPATAWGTGSGGRYAIWRGTTPDFVPGAGNLVVQGVTGTTWTDTTVPAGTPVWYLVRAESDETCGAGPNGGVLDGNTVRLGARDDAGQPASAPVGATLRLGLVNAVHARLTWAPVAPAHHYDVLRANGPAGPFDGLGETSAAASWDDQDAGLDRATRYYLVRSSDACGHQVP